MKKKMPKNWPIDTVVDTSRWCGWLPKNFTIGLKLTENGYLLQCFVGPAPECKRFFHKKDIEKYVGRELSTGERGMIPTELQDSRLKKTLQGHVDVASDLTSSDFLKYTGLVCGLQYMNDRCAKAHGMTVNDALSNLTYTDGEGKTTGGKVRRYAIPDLRYDLKAGRLETVKTRAAVGKAPAKPTGLPKQAGPVAEKRKRASNDAVGDALVTKKARTIEVKRECFSQDAAVGVKMRSSQGTKQEKKAAPIKPKQEPGTSSKAATVGAKVRVKVEVEAKVDSSAWEIYQTTRAQALRGIVSSRDIFTLVGVGRSLGIDGLLLDVLPAVLSKEPKHRGAFGRNRSDYVRIAISDQELFGIRRPPQSSAC